MSAHSGPPKLTTTKDLPPDPGQPMTEKQSVRLRELCRQAQLPYDMALTRRQAAARIAYLAELLR